MEFLSGGYYTYAFQAEHEVVCFSTDPLKSLACKLYNVPYMPKIRHVGLYKDKVHIYKMPYYNTNSKYDQNIVSEVDDIYYSIYNVVTNDDKEPVDYSRYTEWLLDQEEKILPKVISKIKDNPKLYKYYESMSLQYKLFTESGHKLLFDFRYANIAFDEDDELVLLDIYNTGCKERDDISRYSVEECEKHYLEEYLI